MYISPRLLQSQGYRVDRIEYPGSASRPGLLHTSRRRGRRGRCPRRRGDAGAGRAVRPDEVYNLAAMSSVGGPWADAERVGEVNGRRGRALAGNSGRYRDDSGAAAAVLPGVQCRRSSASAIAAATGRTTRLASRRVPMASAKMRCAERVVSTTAGRMGCSRATGSCSTTRARCARCHSSPERSLVAVAEIAEGRASELSLGEPRRAPRLGRGR